MILQVQHETRLEYTGPVSEWLAEVRMEPLSDDRQCCHSFFLGVSQPASLFRYQDGFGNRVHHFNILAPHDQVRILAASIVETEPVRAESQASRAKLPIELPDMPADMFSYLAFRGPVRRHELLEPLVAAVRPAPAAHLVRFVETVRSLIFSRFTYAPDATRFNSPIDDLLMFGKGVCQDFAHLMIAILRAHGVPARYVSGYIHRPNKESQSHAWCEAWVPDLGWLGCDPTNDRCVDESFVKVAIGRDFTDVMPNKGVYRGNVQETMQVRVETRELKRVPPSSWQENLPALDVPLTLISRRSQRVKRHDEQAQQQQQQ